MEIILRNLTKKDSQYFIKWWRDKELIALTSGDFTSLSDQEIQKQVDEMATDKNSVHFMIEADGKIVGHVNLNKIDEETAELQIVIGEKDYWGKGIGQDAIIQILKKAVKIRYKKIITEVRPENQRAINLYKQTGFLYIRNKKYDNPNQLEVLIMEKRLG